MSGCCHSLCRSLDSSSGSAMRNLSLNSLKFLGSYLGKTGMILDKSNTVGPSPALLLEKPLPRARVRPMATTERLGNDNVLGRPTEQIRFKSLVTTSSLGLQRNEKRQSELLLDLFEIESLLRTQRPNRNPLRLRACLRREDGGSHG